MSELKVAVCGLGKAGLPLAAVIAESGLNVTGVDLDEARVAMLNKGENPIPEEPGLAEILKKVVGKNFNVTASYEKAAKEANVFIVIVPLFIDEDTKKPDFSIIESAVTAIGKGLKKGDTVILETTVPVGTTDNLLKNILEKESNLKAGTDFFLAYSPERIMTGYSISRYKEFPKVIGGINSESTEKAFECYSHFAKPVKVTDAKTAELVKVAEGVYRDVNIALANELFKVSEKYEINFWEMREAAKHDFCNIHEPGNVGGHCIPVYPWFLINELDVPLIKVARELNDDMIEYYADKVKAIGGTKAGIIGLSYREGVKEKAYSGSLKMIAALQQRGFTVFGFDPLYSKDEIRSEFSIDPIETFEEMDAIILMNKEKEVAGKIKSMKEKIVDVKNILDS